MWPAKCGRSANAVTLIVLVVFGVGLVVRPSFLVIRLSP